MRQKKIENYEFLLVSLVWGCELKGKTLFQKMPVCKVSLVWGCELKGFIPRLTANSVWVSLVWGCELKGEKWTGHGEHEGSASYEAVNWKLLLCRLWPECPGQPRMRLWIESSSSKFSSPSGLGQPRMRLWIERSMTVISILAAAGQPRMRLWIERTTTALSSM